MSLHDATENRDLVLMAHFKVVGRYVVPLLVTNCQIVAKSKKIEGALGFPLGMDFVEFDATRVT